MAHLASEVPSAPGLADPPGLMYRRGRRGGGGGGGVGGYQRRSGTVSFPEVGYSLLPKFCRIQVRQLEFGGKNHGLLAQEDQEED